MDENEKTTQTKTTCQQAGHIGGTTTAKRYGREHYVRAGKKGGARTRELMMRGRIAVLTDYIRAHPGTTLEEAARIFPREQIRAALHHGYMIVVDPGNGLLTLEIAEYQSEDLSWLVCRRCGAHVDETVGGLCTSCDYAAEQELLADAEMKKILAEAKP